MYEHMLRLGQLYGSRAAAYSGGIAAAPSYIGASLLLCMYTTKNFSMPVE
jgi:hypothetical protein